MLATLPVGGVKSVRFDFFPVPLPSPGSQISRATCSVGYDWARIGVALGALSSVERVTVGLRNISLSYSRWAGLSPSQDARSALVHIRRKLRQGGLGMSFLTHVKLYLIVILLESARIRFIR